MSSENHRFGFNGKERDPSISSLNHNDYDYGFRIYNPLSKFEQDFSEVMESCDPDCVEE